MTTATVEELCHDFPGHLARVVRTQTTVTVFEANVAVAELRPLPPPRAEGLRPFGLCAGEFTVPDDFDDPLPEEILRQFEGG